MLEYLRMFWEASSLAPHGYCLLWQPELVWTHVVADALIAAAYFSIPVAIVRFVTRRKDIEFSWIFWLFALFIVACGTTHLMSIWTLWNADYGYEALIKVITAIASVGTAIVLWPLIPRALALPSPLQLKQANAELGERVRERDQALARLQQEIRERERAEAALVQAQKMEAVGQLTGGIAHDFNNLLQAVSGTLELISRNPADSDKVRNWATRGMQAAERGTRLTGQLLAFSRVQRLDLRPLQLSSLFGELLDLLSRTLGKNVRIDTDFTDGGAIVVADRTQLELALLNLAINARDAMPEGGKVTIRTRVVETCDPEQYPDGCIEVSVTDTGPGMPPEVLDRAFEPFFTTKGVGKGTGLGLSMVYGVAKQSGGDARIETELGRGTSVIITLRRAPAGATAEVAPAGGGVAQLATGAGETIVVVDDDDDVRGAMRGALESLRYRVEEAADGAAALAILRERRPDLLIVDFAMPGMNGAEVAKEAALLHPGLPVLFATGYAEANSRDASVLESARVLRKPFQVEQLATEVAAKLAGKPG